MSTEVANAPKGTIVAAVDNLPVNQKTQEIGAYLNMRLDTIEQALPSNMKGEAQRLIRRAMIYFASKSELHDCTVNSFLLCVVQAAELGLALDGRLCHAVAYNCNAAPKGRPAQWEKRAQCQPDYKGLVSVAKRSKQIADADGDIVCENDHFKYGMVDARTVFEFTPHPDTRGKIRGAFARVILPNGLWSVEYMNLEQLNHVRDKSKAKDSGPWVSDTEQMYVKTAIRRCLKMYCDDPTFIHATEIDDLSDVIEGQIVRSGGSQSRVRLSSVSTLTRPPAIANQSVGTTIPNGTANGSRETVPSKAEEAEREEPNNDVADADQQSQSESSDVARVTFDDYTKEIAEVSVRSKLADLKGYIRQDKFLSDDQKSDLIGRVDEKLKNK